MTKIKLINSLLSLTICGSIIPLTICSCSNNIEDEETKEHKISIATEELPDGWICTSSKRWAKKGDSVTFIVSQSSNAIIKKPVSIKINDIYYPLSLNEKNQYTATVSILYTTGMTVKVQFKDEEAVDYKTVTFKVDSQIVSTQTVVKGKRAIKPIDPTIPGKVFKYWSEDGSTEFEFTKTINIDTTLVALFEDKSLEKIVIKTQPSKILYSETDTQLDLSGLVLTAKYNDKTEEEISYEEHSSEITAEGFVPGQTTEQIITIKYKQKQANFSIVVQGKTIICTITFYLNDGTEESETKVVSTQNIVSGTKITKISAPKTTTNKSFRGWYTNAKGKEWFDFDQTIKADTKLYAQWDDTPTYFNNIAWSAVADACEVFEDSSQTLDDAKTLCKAIGIDASSVTSGTAKECLEKKVVGLTGNIIINNISHNVRCIGAMHDNQNNGKVSALTFELTTILSDKTAKVGMCTPLDTENNEHYTSSLLFKNLNGADEYTPKWYYYNTDTEIDENRSALAMLTDGTPVLSSRIKTVQKNVYQKDAGTWNVVTYASKLFPLTTKEINCQDVVGSQDAEGTTYHYYIDEAHSLIKQDAKDNIFYYWFSTPLISVTDEMAYQAGNLRAAVSKINSKMNGVSFAFCL